MASSQEVSQSPAPVQSPAASQLALSPEQSQSLASVASELLAAEGYADEAPVPQIPSVSQVVEQVQGTEPAKQEGAAAEEKPAETPKIQPKLSDEDRRFAELRRLAIENQRREQELKSKYGPLQEALEKRDLGALAKAMGYQKITDLAAAMAEADVEMTPERAALKEAQRQLAERDRLEQERQAQTQAAQQEQSRALLRGDIQKLVQTNPDFELLQMDGGIDDVEKVMQMHYQNTFDPEKGEGEILPLEVAADYVNKLYQNNLQKLSKLAIVQKVLGMQQQPNTPKQSSAAPASQTSGQVKTLTGDVRGGAEPNRPKSEQEIFDEVVSRLQWAMQQDKQRR